LIALALIYAQAIAEWIQYPNCFYLSIQPYTNDMRTTATENAVPAPAKPAIERKHPPKRVKLKALGVRPHE
jgi:hypothetical protein